jgi:hypothetical protein
MLFGMDRVLRVQHPGSPFYIVARTVALRPWLTEALKPAITNIILRGVASSGAALIAHTVSPSHLHIVLVQGTRTLGHTMQPVLRRVALLVQRTYKVQGHVFERPFESKWCSNPDDLLTAVLHIHQTSPSTRACDPLELSLSDRAVRMLGRIDPGIDIEDLRRPFGTRRMTEVRDQLIAALLAARYTGVAIASFLGVSQATVSRIKVSMWSVGTQNG